MGFQSDNAPDPFILSIAWIEEAVQSDNDTTEAAFKQEVQSRKRPAPQAPARGPWPSLSQFFLPLLHMPEEVNLRLYNLVVRRQLEEGWIGLSPFDVRETVCGLIGKRVIALAVEYRLQFG